MFGKFGIIAIALFLAMVVTAVATGDKIELKSTNSITGDGIGTLIGDQDSSTTLNDAGHHVDAAISDLNNVGLKNVGFANLASDNWVNTNVGSGKLAIDTTNQHDVVDFGTLLSNSGNSVTANLGKGKLGVTVWNLDTAQDGCFADINEHNFVSGYSAKGTSTYYDYNQIWGKNIVTEKGLQTNTNYIDPVGKLEITKSNVAVLESIWCAENGQSNDLIAGIAGHKLQVALSNGIKNTNVVNANDKQKNGATIYNFAPTKSTVGLTNSLESENVWNQINDQDNGLTALVKGQFSSETGNYNVLKNVGFANIDSDDYKIVTAW